MDKIRFTCVDCGGDDFTEADGYEMELGFTCMPCLYGISYKEHYAPDTYKPIPFGQKIWGSIVMLILFVLLLMYNSSQAAEGCVDGTWVYDIYTEVFVCVEDGGIYTPPTD
jgi:hypothetical protein